MNILELAQEAGLVKRLNATDDYLDKLKAFADLVRDDKIAELEADIKDLKQIVNIRCGQAQERDTKLAIAIEALEVALNLLHRTSVASEIITEALNKIQGEA